MSPEISEFSFGFALTNEIVGLVSLQAAPIFPSLVEEGKIGGGYDVKFDRPGIPLYLQFKRADCLVRSSARELRHYGLDLKPPFYRFGITERNRSFQHTSLVALDNGRNQVFYAAPRFYTLADINSAWEARSVMDRSIFVSPADIGAIYDDEKHTVSYDAKSAYLCSEPRRLDPISANGLLAKFTNRIGLTSTPLRDQLSDWWAEIRLAVTRAQELQDEILLRIHENRAAGQPGLSFPAIRVDDRDGEAVQQSAPEPKSEIRSAKPLTEGAELLRSISDEALRSFGAQFYVVQRREDL